MSNELRHRDQTLALNAASLTPEGSAWLLVEPAGGGPGRPVEIGAEPLVLGSAEGCAVRLDDPHVSRRHAEIRRTDNGIVLRDLGSRNGTLVGRIAIKEVVLTSGVEIRIGTTTLHFEMGGESGRLARLAHEPVREEELAHVPARFGPAVGTSAAMRRIFALLGRLAPTELTITLIGETGTGKDVLAHAVHEGSPRARQPFVIFDCGAVASSLIESELFGHEKGSFTGAVAERQGAFERAQGGTLFLDEIGELSMDLQPKLLRVLEQRKVQRVGGGTQIPIDVRIVAATNRDLEERVREGAFRQDLFFRLSVAVLHLPPLRDRRQDIPPLIEHLLAESGKRLQVSPSTMDVLAGHEWPGNVRELRNVLSAAAAMADGPILEPRHLLFFRGHHRRRPATIEKMPLAGQSLEAVERAAIEQTLRQFDGNKTKAARALGIAASTLYEKLKKYGLQDETQPTAAPPGGGLGARRA